MSPRHSGALVTFRYVLGAFGARVRGLVTNLGVVIEMPSDGDFVFSFVPSNSPPGPSPASEGEWSPDWASPVLPLEPPEAPEPLSVQPTAATMVCVLVPPPSSPPPPPPPPPINPGLYNLDSYCLRCIRRLATCVAAVCVRAPGRVACDHCRRVKHACVPVSFFDCGCLIGTNFLS